jgi:hypothetical protein
MNVNRGLKVVPRKSCSAASWHLAALSEKETSARAALQALIRQKQQPHDELRYEKKSKR